jgi:hypothetical protein
MNVGEALSIQDVSVPTQLLSATGNIGSLRDKKPSFAWEPQPALPGLSEGTGNLLRRGTRGSTVGLSTNVPNPRRVSTKYRDSPCDEPCFSERRHRQGSLSPDTVRHEHRTLSFEQGVNETLDVSRPVSITSSMPRAGVSSMWSTDDPFSTSRDTSKDHAGSEKDRPSVQQDTPSVGNEEKRPRRGTLETFVDSLVPDAVQRRFTNASFLRRSSIWQTYESAKKRSRELQREKWVQLTFEYAIYATIISFVYFVLVGVPLWKGAVYWLWWVVAHKFVIAGGFSITLGIALL